MGGLMMVPWDVWQKNGGGPRYFGTAADYADLYGLIRALPELFDGYEAVFCRGRDSDFELPVQKLTHRASGRP